MKIKKSFFGIFFINTFLVLTLFGQTNVKADSTGLPGDNFSLQGAMDLFSKASSPEDFEKAINNEKNNVNNLDLNGDGEIDYIKVIDKKDKDVHAIVLQAVISENESQDVAVIEIEMKGKDDAIAQIVGDADIYGKDVYVEPSVEDNKYDVRVNSDVKSGPAASEFKAPVRLYFNVWAWPCVRYIYQPVYVVYVSPWHWHRYPNWWNPWRPVYWHNFYPRTYHYHHHYHVINQPRCYKARAYHNPHRISSNSVKVRNEKVVNNYRTTNKIVVRNDNNRGRVVDRADSGTSRSSDKKYDRSQRQTAANSGQVPSSRERQRVSTRDQKSERTDITDGKQRSSDRQKADRNIVPEKSGESVRSSDNRSRTERSTKRSQPGKIERQQPSKQGSSEIRNERGRSQDPASRGRSGSNRKNSGRG